MTEQEIVEALELLGTLRASLEEERRLRDADRKAALPAEVAARLEEIDVAFGVREDQLLGAIGRLEGEVQGGVLALGRTVKGADLQAVWSKGRASWDMRALEGYATAHPELYRFKAPDKPTVSIRRV